MSSPCVVSLSPMLFFTLFVWSHIKEWIQFSHSIMSNSLQPHDCSMPDFPVHHHLLEPAQTHVHLVVDVIQLSHLLSCPSPPVFKSEVLKILLGALSRHVELIFQGLYSKVFFLGCFVLSYSVQFSSVTQSCPTIWDPMNCSMPGLPIHHQLPESTQTHVYWVGDAIQPSHPLSSPSPPALNLCQHQGFFKWVSSSHQVAKVVEFQLQHQSFQWIPRTDLL